MNKLLSIQIVNHQQTLLVIRVSLEMRDNICMNHEISAIDFYWIFSNCLLPPNIYIEREGEREREREIFFLISWAQLQALPLSISQEYILLKTMSSFHSFSQVRSKSVTKKEDPRES
jgi:hypothetical protein